MSTKIDIKYNPQGFAECLQSLSGQVQAEAERIAANAASQLSSGGGFHVEMSNEARYQDPRYGVTRPVARVVADDDATAAEEAENKILSKAVSK